MPEVRSINLSRASMTMAPLVVDAVRLRFACGSSNEVWLDRRMP